MPDQANSEAIKPETFPDHIARAATNRGLKLILNTTEQCNLRCTYCYESFLLGRMPPEVVGGVIQLVTRRAEKGLDWLEVEFFGGEPLAAWDVVETISTQLDEIARRYDLRLFGAMTTNATLLTKDRLDHLAECQFKTFQITLDGPAEIHDTRRKTVSGKSSFAQIWQRLEMIKRSQYGDLKVLLRLHFDASSVDAMVESGFLREIARRLAGDDERFVVHFHPLESFGSASKAELAFFADHQSESDAIDRLLAEAQAAGICGEQLPQSNPDALPTGESGHVVCYAASSNSFVIRSDGRVSKCTVAFDDERNVVGRILPTGDLEIDHNKHLPWLRGLISGDQASLGCPAAGLIWAV